MQYKIKDRVKSVSIQKDERFHRRYLVFEMECDECGTPVYLPSQNYSKVLCPDCSKKANERREQEKKREKERERKKILSCITKKAIPEIKELKKSSLIGYVSNETVIDTVLEILDKYTGDEE